jgi:hypothetical protein
VSVDESQIHKFVCMYACTHTYLAACNLYQEGFTSLKICVYHASWYNLNILIIVTLTSDACTYTYIYAYFKYYLRLATSMKRDSHV